MNKIEYEGIGTCARNSPTKVHVSVCYCLRTTVILALFHPDYFVPCSTRGALKAFLVFAKLDKLQSSN